MKKSIKIALIILGAVAVTILALLIYYSTLCMDGKGETWYYPSTISISDSELHFQAPTLVVENAVAYSSNNGCALIFKNKYHIKLNEKFRLVPKSKFDDFINNYPVELSPFVTGCC